jgi:hypothetical protein
MRSLILGFKFRPLWDKYIFPALKAAISAGIKVIADKITQKSAAASS